MTCEVMQDSYACMLHARPTMPPSCRARSATRANARTILHIVVDDLGYDHVGFHNGRFITPNIDALRGCGVHLDSFYSFKTCAPARASILSGRYPFSMGIYENADVDSAGVPTNFTFLPELLRRAGWRTHAVGKWHVGFRSNGLTPTSRGFDSFLGTWHCCTDYYKHTYFGDHAVAMPVMDLARSRAPGGQLSADYGSVGQYSTLLYANETARIIRAHEKPMGLYVYLAFQAVHGPNQVPEYFAARYNAAHPDKHVYEGMVTAVDAAVAKVVQACRAAHLWDSTLMVFHSDNGGVVRGNYPFRGGKFGLWEGGVRVIAFLGGPVVNGQSGDWGRSWRGLGHVADLLPTLLSAAGVTPPAAGDASTGPTNMDGVSLWQAIVENGTSPRHEVVHQVVNRHNPRDCPGADHDQQNCGGAIRVGRWKLLVGYPGDSRTRDAAVSNALDKWALIQRIGGRNASATPRSDGCRIFTGEGCLCWRDSCLYDVEADPGETRDLVVERPEVAARLRRRLAAVSAASAAERAALCGAERKFDERRRKESVERQKAYLPYADDSAWRNDPATPGCVHVASRELRDFYVRAGVSVVGESPFWEAGLVHEYDWPLYNLSSVS